MAQEEYFTKCPHCANELSAPNPRLDKEPCKILNESYWSWGRPANCEAIKTTCTQCGQEAYIYFVY